MYTYSVLPEYSPNIVEIVRKKESMKYSNLNLKKIIEIVNLYRSGVDVRFVGAGQ